VLAELQVAVVPLRQKLRDFLIRGASKEKDFVEIALTGKFGFACGRPVFLRPALEGKASAGLQLARRRLETGIAVRQRRRAVLPRWNARKAA